ncbi:MAG: SidE phosphodiesterase domain-containing protein [Legionella sp.]
MNIAHSLDLLRVYPPSSTDAANSKKNLEKFLLETLRYQAQKGMLTESTIKKCIKDTISMLHYSRRMLDESGDKTMTRVELNDEKIRAIMDDPELTLRIKFF